MKKIISTKENKSTFIKAIFTSILVFVVFIILASIGISLIPQPGYTSNEIDPFTLLTALCFIMAFLIPAILLFSTKKYSATYIEIYEDVIMGQGMEMINGTREGKVIYFNLRYTDIQNIMVKSGWVTLYTNTITYKILTDKNTATQIYNFYISNIRR